MSVSTEQEILGAVERLMSERAAQKPFVPGVTEVPYSGVVADGSEYREMARQLLTGWFGLGKKTTEFQSKVAQAFGKRRGLFVNSGSSANLIAVATLASHRLPGGLRRGNEVVTCAAGFPTTLNPIIQHGLRPKFVDTSLPTYNPTGEMLVEAVTCETKGIMFAHTLGNPYDMRVVMDLVKDYGLWFVEDCCDAIGSTYDGKPAGSFGDIATLSTYVAHHFSTGEGGVVCFDTPYLGKLGESLRDWGRSCFCAPGVDNSCGKRFEWQLGELPYGFDHKYTYEDVGYNLKPLEIQAAMGLEQLKKLPTFHEARRRNFRILTNELKSISDLVVLPEATKGSDPSWFAFPLTLASGIERVLVVEELQRRKVHSRMLFAGNLLRHPAYTPLKLANAGEFKNADLAMTQSFFVGTSPVVTEEMAHYLGRSVRESILAVAGREVGVPLNEGVSPTAVAKPEVWGG